jgi:hypothetical protein
MPLCVTVNVCPPIVNVPVRLFTLVFAATVYVTVALPVGDAPAVTVSQAAFDVAATVLPVAPVAVAVSVVGGSVKLPVIPLCITVKVCPPIMIVAARGATFSLAE